MSVPASLPKRSGRNLLRRFGRSGIRNWKSYSSNSTTSPIFRRVGGKAPNAFGLHDMLGNVYEWVGDWYGDYPGGTVTDRYGPGSGSERVIRGGSWFDDTKLCRSAIRIRSSPGACYFTLGFRLLRE